MNIVINIILFFRFLPMVLNREAADASGPTTYFVSSLSEGASIYTAELYIYMTMNVLIS